MSQYQFHIYPIERIAFYGSDDAYKFKSFSELCPFALNCHSYPLGKTILEIKSLDRETLIKMYQYVQENTNSLQSLSKDTTGDLYSILDKKMAIIHKLSQMNDFLCKLIVSTSAYAIENVALYSEPDVDSPAEIRINSGCLYDQINHIKNSFVPDGEISFYLCNSRQIIPYYLAQWISCIWSYLGDEISIYGYNSLELRYINIISDFHIEIINKELALLIEIFNALYLANDIKNIDLSLIIEKNKTTEKYTSLPELFPSDTLPFLYTFTYAKDYSDAILQLPTDGFTANSIIHIVATELAVIKNSGFMLKTCAICEKKFFCNSKDRRCTISNLEYEGRPCIHVKPAEKRHRSMSPGDIRYKIKSSSYTDWCHDQIANNDNPCIREEYMMKQSEIREMRSLFSNWDRKALKARNDINNGAISENEAFLAMELPAIKNRYPTYYNRIQLEREKGSPKYKKKSDKGFG